jgi:hypothetical protein
MEQDCQNTFDDGIEAAIAMRSAKLPMALLEKILILCDDSAESGIQAHVQNVESLLVIKD